MHRTVTVVAALALAMLLASCAPGPSPAPSATGFASDDEAFAAAEATYRAYVDALNEVDLADPATFEPVYALTTGDASNAARKSFTDMHADEWSVEGLSKVTLVEQTSLREDRTETTLAVCVDVSSVDVKDESGTSVVGDRPDRQSLTVTLVAVDRRSDWLISRFASRDGAPKCY